MIFIARDREERPVGIVSAKNIQSARAYWQGIGLQPNTVHEFDTNQNRENEEMGHVTPILVTKNQTIGKFSMVREKITVLTVL